MIEVLVREEELDDRRDFHRMMARELDFPDYYGNNLDALNDCLGDIYRPTLIMVQRASENEQKAWFSKVCRVMSRAACDNENLIVAYEEWE